MDSNEIDEMLERINSELAEREKRLEALIAEVSKLRSAAKTLEDARAILVAGKPPSDGYDIDTSADNSVSLQAEVMRCIRASANIGLAIPEIVQALTTAKYPNAGSRRFYSTVYITVRRLLGKGEIVEFSTGNKKRYRAATVA